MWTLTTFKEQEKKLEQAKGRRAFIASQGQHLTEELEALARHLENLQKAQEVFQLVAKETMQSLETQWSSLVTMALRAVFPDAPAFRLKIDTARGRPECEFCFVQGDEESSVLETTGGGVLDVASFALRVAYWSLKQSAPVFLLDEPFKFVSPDLQGRVELMLRMFCEQFGVQIIMVSHAERVFPNSEMDRVLVCKKQEGVSVMRKGGPLA